MRQKALARKLEDCSIGLRGYAAEEAQVEDVAERLYRSATQAHELGFGRTIILVPRDKDCGKTILTLGYLLAGIPSVAIHSPGGNENSDVLNEGLRFSQTDGRKHFFVMSNKAVKYLTKENVRKILVAFHEGALVAGLTLRDDTIPDDAEDELYIDTLRGFLLNTFCAWDLAALLGVGGFDSQIGVEEVAPSVRLIKKNGPCLAPIFPTDQVGISVSALRAGHHRNVLTTKMKRQFTEMVRVGGSPELIKNGILPGYPR